MARESRAEKLFQLGALVPWCGAAYQCNEEAACIEGARMALARVKTYWAEMEATAVASPDSDESRVLVEHYFQEVLQGARLIETQCSKDTIFE